MAQALALNDIIETVACVRLGGQNGLNVRHWLVTALVGSQVTDADVAVAFSADVAPLYKTALTNTATYRGMTAQIIRPTRRTKVGSSSGTGVGTGGAEPEAAQVAGLSKLTTTLTGRHNRGRLYIPFMSEGDIDSAGALSAGYTTKLANLASWYTTPGTVVSGGSNAVLSPVVYDRVAHTTVLLVDHVERPYPATQRRRSLLNNGDDFIL